MKIAPRATVSQEFIDLMLNIYKNKLRYIKTRLDEVHPRARQSVLNENRMVISKLVTIVTDKKALDFEITRLRALNYQKYEVRQNSGGRVYLCGLSFPIKLKLHKSYDGKRNFDLGPYWVCIPTATFGYQQDVGLGSFHFYPDKAPMSLHRHPHHNTSSTDISIRTQNPLDMNSGTCFGGFNSIIYTLAEKADIVEYFRSIYIYLNRIDTGSLLGTSHAYNYPFAQEVLMKIELAEDVALQLLTVAHAAKGLEFSGFGFVELRKETIFVYDVIVLDVGNEVWTEIDPKTLISLMERPDARNMKLWLHRHPVGNGIPGDHNWSGTDNATIAENPLGGHPDLVKWSCSMVLTPKGWVGRVDNHIKKITQHLEVEPQALEAYAIVEEIKKRKPVQITWSNSDLEADEMADTLDELQEASVIANAVYERIPKQLMQELGLSFNDLVNMVLDSYYNGDDEMLDTFLDQSASATKTIELMQERI